MFASVICSREKSSSWYRSADLSPCVAISDNDEEDVVFQEHEMFFPNYKCDKVISVNLKLLIKFFYIGDMLGLFYFHDVIITQFARLELTSL